MNRFFNKYVVVINNRKRFQMYNEKNEQFDSKVIIMQK